MHGTMNIGILSLGIYRNSLLFKYTANGSFVGVLANLRKATISIFMSERNNSAHTGRIFIKFDVSDFSKKTVEKIQVLLKYDKYNGYFTRRPIYIYHHISLTSSFDEKCFREICTENQNTNICSIIFSRKSRRL